MFQLVRPSFLVIWISICLVAYGCQSVPKSELSPSLQTNNLPGDRPVQIGEDNGKPIYALAQISITRKVAYAAPAKLHTGRFAFPDYQDPALVQAVRAALYENFQDQVSFYGKSENSYKYETSLQPTRRLKKRLERVVDNVTADRSVSLRGPHGNWRPDYIRSVQSTEFDLPGSLERSLEGAKASQREWINMLVSYVQAIPYGVPPNGFLYPDEVLKYNYGDCDSKSVLAAAIIQRSNLDLDYAFIDLPSADHMLFGVALPPLSGDRTVRLKGKAYVLIEMSGPALVPPGKISELSETALRKASSYGILSLGGTVGL